MVVGFLGEYKSSWIFKTIEIIAQKYDFKITDAIETIPQENGYDFVWWKRKFSVVSKVMGITKDYKIDFKEISNFIKNQYDNSDSASIKRWAKEFMDEKNDCPECKNAFKKRIIVFQIKWKNIGELVQMDVAELSEWFADLPIIFLKTTSYFKTEIVKITANYNFY